MAMTDAEFKIFLNKHCYKDKFTEPELSWKYHLMDVYTDEEELIQAFMRDEQVDREYAIKLIKGIRYQNLIKDVLKRKFDFDIHYYVSKKEQLIGESVERIEVKSDPDIDIYGNLYIEFGEKKRGARYYQPSGILRNDNTLVWLQGDNKRFFVMAKEHLLYTYKQQKDLPQHKRYVKKWVDGDTSQGMCIPINELVNRQIIVYQNVI